MASEMVVLSKETIISQVADAMLSQANQQPEQILKLIQ